MNNLLKTLLSFGAALFSLSVSAQNITGTWQGDLNVQGKHIPVVFHIAKDISNKLSASFDSPSQNVFNLKCSDVIVKADSVSIFLAAVNIKYVGLLGNDKRHLSGLWFQGPGSLTLTLDKTSESASVVLEKRPQTPQQPYPYESEEIEFTNPDQSIKYGGTLTYPKSSGAMSKHPIKYPAVVLITGSGQQDRDETIFGHKSFAVIADYLTKKGFAVLRVDDRGMGKTTGDYASSSSLDFARDVEVGIDYLKRDPHIDINKIGLIGHSEGGMIAPIVANERKDVKFIVLLAAPGIATIDLMQQQVEASAISEGIPVEEAQVKGFLLKTVWTEAKKHNTQDIAIKNIRVKIDSMFKNLDPEIVKKVRPDASILNSRLTDELTALTGKWYSYFIKFEPKNHLQKLNCKVLAINGDKDVQVNAEENLKGIRNALAKSQSRQYDIVELPGLNHMFQTCKKCSPSEYHELEETFSPTALQTIGNWLMKNLE